MYQRVYERKEKYKNSFKFCIDEYFGISKYNSTVKTEILAGLTTFMTMAYIIIVDPLILSTAGMDYKAVFVATCLSAATATLFMGLIAKKPFGMATGLGLNSVVAFGLILTLNLPWEIAMGLIFIEGLMVFILVLTNLREMVMHAIPHSLKMSIGVGIGMFISFIGFKLAHIVTASPENLIKFGDVGNPVFIIAAVGIVIIMVFMSLKIKGSILYGIILTTIIAIGACLVADYYHVAFNLLEILIYPLQLPLSLRVCLIFHNPSMEGFLSYQQLRAFQPLAIWILLVRRR